uniref:Ovule protein n=1 Tax=Mesocestoides corti TaxID=53468 RepID=A0A5K3FCX6_MESCO
MSTPLFVTSEEYPSSSMQQNGKTKQALLTNNKPEPHVRRGSSESNSLPTPPIIYPFLNVFVSG